MIYGQKIVDSVSRSRYNFELDRDFNSPNVIGVVKRAMYRAVPESRRNQRRTKYRLVDGVNSDCRARGRTLHEIEYNGGIFSDIP
jgi:hypothetical protein